MPEIPEISVAQLAERLRTEDDFILLDVREEWELQAARLADSRLVVVPMSSLAQSGTRLLPPAAQSPDADLLIICHHGNRSGQVAAWLHSRGWTRVYSVAGGMDEYARQIDPSVGSY